LAGHFDFSTRPEILPRLARDYRPVSISRIRIAVIAADILIAWLQLRQLAASRLQAEADAMLLAIAEPSVRKDKKLAAK